jgi:hypothetical protein
MLHRDTDDASGVLAGRLAATLVSHDPGWRLPRPSEIARRHNVPVDDVHAAIRELVGRNLIRQAPDGYLYLTGPAEYRASLEGITGLSTHVDPMGGDLTCTSFGVSRQTVSTDAASALRITPGSQVGVLKLAWALNGAPAAMSTTYLTNDIVELEALNRWLAEKAERGELPIPSPGPVPASPPEPLSLPDPVSLPESSAGLGPLADPQWRNPHAVSVQMQLPSASAARRLRLNPGQMALIVTMLFRDGPDHQPTALTVTVLRPDLFRVRLETPQAGLDGERLQAALALAATD